MAGREQDVDIIPAGYKPSKLLPIARHRQALLYLVEKYPITIVVGQTGSGKTTQIPQYLFEAGWAKEGRLIACTQPRRVAATSVAMRVAEEVGCRLGEEVGYSIRFEDMTSSRTCIKYLTDGLLLREALVDPLLSRYSVIMIDEAHERSLATDILLGILKKIRKKRDDLRIIISSATLQAEEFCKFFLREEEDPAEKRARLKADVMRAVRGEEDVEHMVNLNRYNRGQELVRIISLEGRMYPVDILYLEDPTNDYVEKAVQTVFDIHLNEGEGDILVFLPGREDIETAIAAISERAATLHPSSGKLLPLPLYAGLSNDQQMAAFEPTSNGARKVIVSTNIAEASVTIDGIVFVVDSGFVKVRAFNPYTGIETLTATGISKASAIQRAGRAGRTKSGKCYRLYTEDGFKRMQEASTPEIQRTNLASVILQLKALGIDNIVRFDFLTSPPAELASRGMELLFSLGAVDEYARLTKPFGHRLADIPVSPMLGTTLLNSVNLLCTDEILTIAAMLTSQPIFLSQTDVNKKPFLSSRRKFTAEEGDHLTLLNVYHAFTHVGNRSPHWARQHFLNYRSLMRAVSVRGQLKRYLDRFEMRKPEGEERARVEKWEMGERVRRCLTMGYFANAARMQPDGSFLAAGGAQGTKMFAHPTSVVFNRRMDWVVFEEVVETGSKVFIKDITSVKRDWLLEYAPGFYQMRGGGHTL